MKFPLGKDPEKFDFYLILAREKGSGKWIYELTTRGKISKLLILLLILIGISFMSSNSGMTEKIIDYIKIREQDRLEKIDKEADKARKNAKPEELAELETKLKQKREEEEARFIPKNWLSDAAERAKQLSFVTHALKFVHPDAKGTNLFAEYRAEVDKTLISGASLDRVRYDVVGNAAALDVGKLLLLEDQGKALIDVIREDDITPLLPFADNEEQVQTWLQGFKCVLEAKELSSHKQAKQIYWPVGEDEYHLLSPLFSSSLAHKLYEKIQDTRFSEEAKEIRRCRRENIFSDKQQVNYINIATQSFGGTKPQNISQLNSQRGGKSYLLSAEPPTWQYRRKPPLKIQSFFTRYVERRCYRDLDNLKKYLERIHQRENNMWIKSARTGFLDDLLGETLNCAAYVQNMNSGWSADETCLLPEEEKLWLDPKRGEWDESFAKKREEGRWQSEVARNFARWICQKLQSDVLSMAATEMREFKALLEPELRLNLKQIEGAVL